MILYYFLGFILTDFHVNNINKLFLTLRKCLKARVKIRSCEKST